MLSFFKKVFFLLALFFVFSSSANAQSQVMQKGEYLKYEVKFLGIVLGTIETFNDGLTTINGKSAWAIRYNIKSSPSIPFMKLDATFKSYPDAKVSHTHKFYSLVKYDDKPSETLNVDYLYDQKKISLVKTKGKESEKLEFDTEKKWSDGGSIYFLARYFMNLNKTVKVPTLIDKNMSQTIINFRGKKTTTNVEAVKYPVKTVFFDGIADWEGLYGLKGKFEGWASDDEASIPVLAKMNLYVGDVTVELVKWKREGWTPPK